MRGFTLGRLFGIEIGIDWSLLIIFFLITFSLAAGLFPAWHPDWSAPLAWFTALVAATVFFASVLAHELSHAVVGRARGIEVKRITLFVFGGMAHMENEPRAWRDELWMAIVGPITSLVLGVGFLVLAGWFIEPGTLGQQQPEQVFSQLAPVPTVLLWLGNINIILALFNLVPGFPLDGGRVLRAVLWGITGDMQRATRSASQAGQVFAWFLIACGLAMILGVRLPVFGSGLLPGVWLAFIGWFLNNAAIISYRQLLIQDVLEDVPVRRLMQTGFPKIPTNTTVAELIDEHLLGTEHRVFPVFDNERFAGLVCLHDIRQLPPAERSTTPVGRIMRPLSELTTASPREDAAAVLQRLGHAGVNQLPVTDNGELQGIIRREDIMQWLSLYGSGEIRDSLPGR
ncbi:MAG: site-2 protease family protein [Halioglobus sp.]|nr:site-2 protease family protein [Halioglobus sp.]